jgi:hypothetical protein
MARLFSFLTMLAAMLAIPFTLGCRPLTDGNDSEALGTFVVNGVLVENGCAPGLSPINPLEFRVEISRNRNAVTWRIPGGAPAFGSLRSNGELRVQRTVTVEGWPADPDNGVVGCSLSQIETIEGTLELPAQSDGAVEMDDAGVMGQPSLEGSHRIEVVPVPGSDCSALLVLHGGSFPALPCAARYELEGTAE